MDGGVQVVTLTLEKLRELLADAAAAGADRALARVLPPFSQHSPPPGVSARAFLAACRDGCRHTKKGRTLFVERAAWDAWTSARPMRAPRAAVAVNVRAHPTPANALDPKALLDEARRR